MENILIGLGGFSTFIIGMYQLGRWSARNQIKELEEVKKNLLDSNLEVENIITDIDLQITKLNDYNKLTIFKKKNEYIKVDTKVD